MRPNFRSTTWASTIQTSCRLMHHISLASFVPASKLCQSPSRLKISMESRCNKSASLREITWQSDAIWSHYVTLDLSRWIFDVFMSTKSIRDPCGFHRQVVPETTVELQEGSDAIPSACSCTNPNVPPEVSATYGASFDLWWCGSGI